VSAGSAGQGGESGMTATLPTPCEGEEERVSGSGFMKCDNGLVHRPAPGVCPPYEKTTTELPPSLIPEDDDCNADGDCLARDHGACVAGGRPYGGVPSPNRCVYGCTVDAECNDGNICVCTATRGECRPSDCARDSDCGSASYCAEFAPTCSGPSGFRCQSAEDACQLWTDCMPNQVCGLRGERRVCDYLQCPG
jgi:hypothetical protein